MVEIVPRALERKLAEYVEDFRVVVVNGPRQAGKTTLLRLHLRGRRGEFRTLDDPEMLLAALADPVAFAADAPRPLCIDEVQRAGDPLVRAVKMVVDENWDAGSFILSGSTRFLTVPTLSESLAGRAAILELWPLSMSERTRSFTNFVDQVFSDPEALRGGVSPWARHDYFQVIARGGYPEALRMRSESTRRGWYDSYLETVVKRDLLEFVQIQQARSIPDLLALLAARAGSTLVLADLARSLGGLSVDTVRNYLSYLETVFLVGHVPAWSTNLTSKIAKAPKSYLTDSGLAAHLLDATPATFANPVNRVLGGMTETFVYTELMKALSVSSTSASLHHFREHNDREIDFVLETRDGRVVAIEVKASSSPPRDATANLRWMRDRLGDRFAGGYLLYLGEHTLSHGDRITAIPLSVLWGHAVLSGRQP
ncbi:ATP-binding protein [Streptosporangium sp. NPDC087985]|uniref:ATP-binding protein n=1 Tax=Streptosporangium sp. NPDC087985 TaxID=3366196 RepID=UPI00380CE3F5